LKNNSQRNGVAQYIFWTLLHAPPYFQTSIVKYQVYPYLKIK